MESRDVIALVRQMSDGLGPAVVDLRTASPAPGALTLELIPTNQASAPVGVRIAASGETDAVVSLGGTAFEIPAQGAGYSDGSGLDDIRQLISAAIDGRFRECVWYRGAKEVRREGVLYRTDDREIRLTHVSPSWFLRRRAKLRETRFDPYE